MTAARKIRATETTDWTGLGAGHVVTLGDRIGVELEAGETVDARRAKSCLTMPEVGEQGFLSVRVTGKCAQASVHHDEQAVRHPVRSAQHGRQDLVKTDGLRRGRRTLGCHAL